MKKLFTILFLFVSTFLLSSSVAYATPGVMSTPSADPTATFIPLRANEYFSTVDDGLLCQKFKPTRSFMADYIDIRAAGSTTSGASLILYTDNGSPDSAMITYSPPSSFNDGRNTMSRFTAPIYTQIIPGEYYWICLSSRNGAYWYADTTADGAFPSSTYNYGYAKVGINAIGNADFGFIAYTSNMEAAPEPEPDPVEPDPVVPDPITPDPVVQDTTPAADTPLPTGVTEGTGDAPAATTTTIKPASALAVIDVPTDQGGALQLTWTASVTTDIDGYKVFRSTTEATKDFQEIARTEKTILTYTDNKAAIGTQYYYMVRAYKTTKESVSTSVVNGTSVDNLAPATPVNPTYIKESPEVYTFTWEQNKETDLAGYSLIVADANNPTVILETISVGKDLTTYSLELSKFSTLATDGVYTFQLVAEDTQANLSEEAMVEGVSDNVAEEAVDLANTFVKKLGKDIIWYVAGGFAVLLLATGGGLLYWFKFRKPAVKKVNTPVVEPPVETKI